MMKFSSAGRIEVVAKGISLSPASLYSREKVGTLEPGSCLFSGKIYSFHVNFAKNGTLGSTNFRTILRKIRKNALANFPEEFNAWYCVHSGCLMTKL